MPAQGIKTPPYSTGTKAVGTLLEGYIFDSGLHFPEFYRYMSLKFPQYTATYMLDLFGGEDETVAQDIHEWSIMNRTRKGATATDVTGNVLTLDIAASGSNLGYFLVGDKVWTEKGKVLKVTAVGAAGGFQTITCAQMDGTGVETTDIVTGEKIGHLGGRIVGEKSTPVFGRVYTPFEDYNYVETNRIDGQVSGDELLNKIWLDDGQSWYFHNQQIELMEFRAGLERSFMFGTRAVDGTTRSCGGIWEFVNNGDGHHTGIKQTFAGSPDEQDIQEFLRKLLKNGSTELVAFCGADFITDAVASLKDYAIGTSQGIYGSKVAGINFDTYQFVNSKLHLIHYPLFDDTETLPYTGDGTASKVNFSRTALALDMGTDNIGDKLFKPVYKEHMGRSRKFIAGYLPGMANAVGEQGGQVATLEDSFSYSFMTEYSLRRKHPERHGILTQLGA